jgi:pimeloyl-ACP methyl ester carboxylesterase
MFPAAVAAVAVVGLIVVGIFTGGGGDDTDPVGGQAADSYPLDRTVEIVSADNVRLSGTLTLPVGREPVGGVLIVPGFGTVDRDKVMNAGTPGGPADRLAQDVNLASSGNPDPLFEDISGPIVLKNLATLRYDKRGIGKSMLPEDARPTYDDAVADARAALTFMTQRAELEGKPIVVLGYDQGAVTAMRLAGDPNVRGLVLVSPPGRPQAEVLADHFVRTHGPGEGRTVAEQVRSLSAALVAGGDLPDRATLSGHIRPMFPAGSEEYHRQVFAIDPVAEARAVRVPVLLLRGGGDPNVTAGDAEALVGALAGTSEVTVVEGGDHNLVVEGERHRPALDAIVAFATRHIGA